MKQTEIFNTMHTIKEGVITLYTYTLRTHRTFLHACVHWKVGANVGSGYRFEEWHAHLQRSTEDRIDNVHGPDGGT